MDKIIFTQTVAQQTSSQAEAANRKRRESQAAGKAAGDLAGRKEAGRDQSAHRTGTDMLSLGGVIYQPTEEGKKLWEQAYWQDVLERMQEQQKQQDRKNPASDSIKAMRIARSIMKGDIVPAKDEKFLIEYNPELYKAAKNIAMLKEQGEKVKSELKDEKASAPQVIVCGVEAGQEAENSTGEETSDAPETAL